MNAFNQLPSESPESKLAQVASNEVYNHDNLPSVTGSGDDIQNHAQDVTACNCDACKHGDGH